MPRALLRSLLPFAFPETGSWCQSRPWAGRAPQPWPCARGCLESIWYAFTALDVEKSGKVSSPSSR